MRYVLIALLLVPFVSAEVVVHQVLYDPVNAESGGEAVELRNTGSEPVDISGWVLATQSSAADATIPESTVLQPGGTFLVADAGWEDKRDRVEWRSADHEETLTLGNRNGGVAVVADGSVVDAVGWGDEEELEGLFEGSPAEKVEEGMALVRVEDTGENALDFRAMAPDFSEGVPVVVLADVSIGLPVIEVSRSLDLSPEGVLVVRNNGEAPKSIALSFNELRFGENVIPKSAIDAEAYQFTVQEGEEKRVSVQLNAPPGVVPGKYVSTLRVVIS